MISFRILDTNYDIVQKSLFHLNHYMRNFVSGAHRVGKWKLQKYSTYNITYIFMLVYIKKKNCDLFN